MSRFSVRLHQSVVRRPSQRAAGMNSHSFTAKQADGHAPQPMGRIDGQARDKQKNGRHGESRPAGRLVKSARDTCGSSSRETKHGSEVIEFGFPVSGPQWKSNMFPSPQKKTPPQCGFPLLRVVSYQHTCVSLLELKLLLLRQNHFCRLWFFWS